MSRINRESIEMLMKLHTDKLVKHAMEQRKYDNMWTAQFIALQAQTDLLEDILALDHDLPQED